MSDNSTLKTETTEAIPPTVVQPHNQWAMIRRSFGKRKLAVFSLYLILFLITTSIFAPFIANDRPITYLGQNQFEYNLSYIYLTSQLPKLSEDQTKTTEIANNKTTKTPAKKKSLKEIIDFEVGLMSHHLKSDDVAKLKELHQQITKLADSSDSLGQKKIKLKKMNSLLEKSFASENITLRIQRYWPVFSSLNGIEITLILFNILVLLLPFYNYFARSRFPKQQILAVALFILIVPLASGLLWWLTVPHRLDRTNYKSAVFAINAKEHPQAHVIIESSIWTPITYGIDEYNLNAINSPPEIYSSVKPTLGTWDTPHWLGTDGIGRDLLTRMIWGGRISLAVGIVAVSIYVTIGIIVGSIAGYFGGIVDLLLSRFIEMVIVFPSFFLILTVIAFVGPSIFNIMVIIGLTGWTGVARLVRGEFLRLKAQEFVLAGRALGYSPLRIIYRHILPNALAPVLVSATFGIAGAILTESALSFLGLGITIPKPSWGGILSTARTTFATAPWLTYFPGLAIFITITVYNLVGEAFRDAADPRLRGK